jgi:hypothetical protein
VHRGPAVRDATLVRRWGGSRIRRGTSAGLGVVLIALAAPSVGSTESIACGDGQVYEGNIEAICSSFALLRRPAKPSDRPAERYRLRLATSAEQFGLNWSLSRRVPFHDVRRHRLYFVPGERGGCLVDIGRARPLGAFWSAGCQETGALQRYGQVSAGFFCSARRARNNRQYFFAVLPDSIDRITLHLAKKRRPLVLQLVDGAVARYMPRGRVTTAVSVQTATDQWRRPTGRGRNPCSNAR